MMVHNAPEARIDPPIVRRLALGERPERAPRR